MNELAISQRGLIQPHRNENPYIKRVIPLEPRTPKRSQIHRSFVFTFNPGEFFGDPWDTVPHVFQIPVSGGEIGVGRTGEAEMDIG